MPDSARLAVETNVEAGAWPSQPELEALTARAVAAVFDELGRAASPATELGVTFSDDAHVHHLNREWRNKDRPTNVLSFPAMQRPADGSLPPMLGDIVLAAETLAREAVDEGKPLADHATHLLVHGLLHLLGFDHEAEEEAERMEEVERRALARLAIPDPYD